MHHATSRTLAVLLPCLIAAAAYGQADWTALVGPPPTDETFTAVLPLAGDAAVLALAADRAGAAVADAALVGLSADDEEVWRTTLPNPDSLATEIFAVVPLGADSLLAGVNRRSPGSELGRVELVSLGSDGAIGSLRRVDLPAYVAAAQALVPVPGGSDLLVGGYGAAVEPGVEENDAQGFVARITASGTSVWLAPELPLLRPFRVESVAALDVVDATVYAFGDRFEGGARVDLGTGELLSGVRSPYAAEFTGVGTTTTARTGDTLWVARADLFSAQVYYVLGDSAVGVLQDTFDAEVAFNTAFLNAYGLDVGATLAVWGGRNRDVSRLEFARDGTPLGREDFVAAGLSTSVANAPLRRAALTDDGRLLIAGSVADDDDADALLVSFSPGAAAPDVRYVAGVAGVTRETEVRQVVPAEGGGAYVLRREGTALYVSRYSAVGEPTFDGEVPFAQPVLRIRGAAERDGGGVVGLAELSTPSGSTLTLFSVGEAGEDVRSRELDRYRTVAEGPQNAVVALGGDRYRVVSSGRDEFGDIGEVEVVDGRLERDRGFALEDGVATIEAVAEVDGDLLVTGFSGDRRLDPAYVERVTADGSRVWRYESGEVDGGYPIPVALAALPDGGAAVLTEDGARLLLDAGGRELAVDRFLPEENVLAYGAAAPGSLRLCYTSDTVIDGLLTRLPVLTTLDVNSLALSDTRTLPLPGAEASTLAQGDGVVYLGGRLARGLGTRGWVAALSQTDATPTRERFAEIAGVGLWPNPVAAGGQRLRVASPSAPRRVDVFAATGERVFTAADAREASVDLPALAPGTYYVRLRFAEGVTALPLTVVPAGR